MSEPYGKLADLGEPQEITLINGKCMVHGHEWADDGSCNRPQCGGHKDGDALRSDDSN